MVWLEDDAVGSKPIGDRDRHLRVDDGLADPHRRGGARGQLQFDLVTAHAALEQVVEAEVDDVVEHGVGRGRRDPLALEAARHDVHPPADDSEQERIADRDRQLVAHRSRALGVAVKEEVGHGGVNLPLRSSSGHVRRFGHEVARGLSRSVSRRVRLSSVRSSYG